MCLLTRAGTPARFGRDRRQLPVRAVADVVEARDVHAAGRGQAQQQLVARRGPVGLPVAHDVGDRADDLLAVTQHGGVDEVGDRLGVERGVPAGDDDRVARVAVGRVQRDAGQVEHRQQVGVAELGRERDAEQVERGDRTVRVDGELADAVGPHQRLEVGPDGVAALGQGVRPLVDDLVEDLHALVRQADLVGVRVEQRPVDGDRVPVLGARVELAADVLDRLGHLGQQRLKPVKQRFDGHVAADSTGVATSPAPLALGSSTVRRRAAAPTARHWANIDEPP